MGYEIDHIAGEKSGCSFRLTIADRIFYVKHFANGSSRFFSGDQKGIIQKEISKTEFDLWVNVLSDDDAQTLEIKKKIAGGKKY